MKEAWKSYVLDSGIRSLENEEVEERAFYRVKVFLKNTYQDRYSDEQKQTKSFLYNLVMNLQQQKEPKQPVSDCDLADEVYIDNHKMLVSWSKRDGLVILPEDTTGNYLILGIANQLKCSNMEI